MSASPDHDTHAAYLDKIRHQLTRYDVDEVVPAEWSLRRRVVVRVMNVLTPLSMGKTPFGKRIRELGLDWPTEAETMIGMRRLTSLQQCVETVIAERVPGDLVECGVWRGGACILMRAVLAAYGDKTRSVWLCDSFAGVPPPDPENYAIDKWSQLFRFAPVLAVSQEQVKANFERYGLLDDQVRFVPGWFKDTLHDAPIESISVLRLDGDLYESTIEALDGLYPRLSPRGFCIIDDYNLAACRQAVTDYRETHGISAEIVDIDGSGVFWRKQ